MKKHQITSTNNKQIPSTNHQIPNVGKFGILRYGILGFYNPHSAIDFVHPPMSRCLTFTSYPLSLSRSAIRKRHRDRAVPASSAAETDGKIALPFVPVARRRYSRNSSSLEMNSAASAFAVTYPSPAGPRRCAHGVPAQNAGSGEPANRTSGPGHRAFRTCTRR
jgi:hypothetical protein